MLTANSGEVVERVVRFGKCCLSPESRVFSKHLPKQGRGAGAPRGQPDNNFPAALSGAIPVLVGGRAADTAPSVPQNTRWATMDKPSLAPADLCTSTNGAHPALSRYPLMAHEHPPLDVRSPQASLSAYAHFPSSYYNF